MSFDLDLMGLAWLFAGSGLIILFGEFLTWLAVGGFKNG